LFRKDVPAYAIAFLSAQRTQQFYVAPTAVMTGPASDAKVKNETLSSDEKACPRGSWLVDLDSSLSSSKKSNTQALEPLSEVLPLLRIWLSLPHPFYTQGEIFKKAGVTSGSKQSRMKKTLIRHTLIVEHRLQTGRTKAVVWEPTEKAYNAVGLAQPQFPSKGGYLHQFGVHQVMGWGKENNYLAEIEYLLPNNKSVDVLLKKEKEVSFVEVGISRPIDKEIHNIVKDLSSGMVPDKLLMAVKDGKTKKKIEELIRADEYLSNCGVNIEVTLIGDFIMKERR
jgi:hypothetical protein